jgi:hypothetical protein
MNSFKRFILWDYRRGSVQYDLMVGLILAFVFLTPRDWFKDQPKASSVTMLQTAHGASAFWIDSDVLNSVPEADKLAKASQVVKNRTGRKENVVRLEPIVDSEKEIKGYMAFTSQ